MLHILWMILKIIGIILAAILGILVLLLCIALFVPLRYRLESDCQGTPESLNGELKATWLLHLVSIYVTYHDQKVKWQLRVAWKKFNVTEGGMSVDEAEEAVKEKVAPEVEETAEEVIKGVEGPADKPVKEIAKEIKEDAGELKEDSVDAAKEIKEEIKSKKSTWDKLKAIWEKIKSFFTNIKYTIRKIYDKIRLLIEKKQQIQEFLTDKVHKEAFVKAKKEVVRLLKYLKPKQFKAKAIVGFDDPYNTGRLLAGYSMLYPFVGEYAVLTPDFEQKRLEGNLFIKGRIKMVYFVIVGWNLFWCKAVRRTYQDIRGFKL